MPSQRCDYCGISYPPNRRQPCEVCGGVLEPQPFVRPDRDWQEKVNRLTTRVDTLNEELGRVVSWRLAELLRAGYDIPSAEALADRVDVDLHAAIELVTVHGCQADVALRILL